MNQKISFEFYDQEEFREFLDSLPSADAASLDSLLIKIEAIGVNDSIKLKWVKKIIGEDNLYEVRSKRGSNIQRALYFHKINNQYVITNYFTKKSQKISRKEILKAKSRRRLYNNKLNHQS
ncbi:type II toxin-antitoxin system RelE/ParE family toxin [Lactobacillus sp. ESL0791]|uniref:type II toxin-antitoxin system RelE/ParE family toxin n=1 Tax=Lactobacillus sp. ESL0791 TaxID=2983234 RepID=UPI0023F9C3D4|nr:type II toxin-antitoxin system RelE/ParE family toxin [Lactobacillus sp. ESL0791]MDF7639779.1 type II toxin-antitoxin system RelE/ParE family toxin [Lactobacillus sp. ESL0791]